MGTKKVKPIQIKPNKSNVLLIEYLQIEQVEIRPHKNYKFVCGAKCN